MTASDCLMLNSCLDLLSQSETFCVKRGFLLGCLLQSLHKGQGDEH